MYGACVLTAYLLAIRSWDGEVFVYLGSVRSPSAVRSPSEYGVVHGRNLGQSIEEQLLSEARLDQEEGHLGIQLGNPILRYDGRKSFACSAGNHPGLFDRVEIEFSGLGVLDSGEVPRLIVNANCASLSEPELLETIWLPIEDIQRDRKESTIRDKEERVRLTVRLEHLPEEWPPEWVMTRVRFYQQDNPAEAVTLDSTRLRNSGRALLRFSELSKTFR